jgi:tetracycline repressor-like protein
MSDRGPVANKSIASGSRHRVPGQPATQRALPSRLVDGSCVEATALTMLGALREATLYIARSDNYKQARQDAGAVMDRLIDSLRTA